MSKASYVFTFVIGAAIGSVVTWKLVQKKYEMIAQEEIDSVKEAYRDAEYDIETEDDEPDEVVKQAKEKPDIMEYAAMLAKQRYVQSEDHGGEPTKIGDDPCVISPDEFGDEEDYDRISLTYYADGTLADDNDEVVKDVDATVGLYSLETFGQFEDDAVHVRNDARKCYFEILRDERCYDEVVAEKPHPSDFYEE